MSSLAQHAQDIAQSYQPPATGRPSLLSSESTVREFLEAVGAGNYIETACKLSGLSKASVYEWLKRAQAGEDAFKAFADALEKAEARAEAHLVGLQRKAAEAGPQYWAAAATQLERRHPDRWSRRMDDSQAPKVVVQIGVGAGDVKVGVAFAPAMSHDVLSSPLEAKGETPANLLETQPFAVSSSPITAIMVPNAEACQSTASTPVIGDSLRSDRAGDPTPTAGRKGRARTFFSGKGRSGAPKRKKGHGL